MIKALLKRWIAYLLLPAGLVLLFVPLCTHRMEEIEKDFLFLKNSEHLLAAKTSSSTEPPQPKPASAAEAWQQMNERQKQKTLEDAHAKENLNPY